MSNMLSLRAARSRFLLVLYVGWALTLPCFAEDTTPGLVVETVAETRVEAKTAEFAPADRLKIGDEIFYSLRVRNTSGAAIDDAVVIRALPRNTRYVSDSAVGPAAMVSFSVNGGKSFSRAEQLVVASSDGAMRPAMAGDYTHIRWQLKHPLAPGATALLRFRGVFQ